MPEAPARPRFDAVVVGAGPAGSCAATVLARAGHSVVLVERGQFPGSKNMYGGVVYPRILDDLHPQWWEEMPVQRWVTRRSTMVLTDEDSVAIEVRSGSWGRPPYNGATALRPELDRWLAAKAVEAGATLVTSTTVLGVRRDGAGQVIGVSTDRPDGDIDAPLVIACDGVNSFLSKQAGLYPHGVTPHHFTLGVKRTIELGADVINQRFGVDTEHGVDIEIVGQTSGVNGGGFLYTNRTSVALGVVLSLDSLAAQQTRPEDIIEALARHPAIEPLVRGGSISEYSAHLIPEAGLPMMPTMTADGLLIAGDAAALCLAAGIWLEGVNFAMGSGRYAGEAADEALRAGDLSARGLAGYQRRLDETFVMRDHRKLQPLMSIVLSDRIQHQYPAIMTGVARDLFTVTNPKPKAGIWTLMERHRKRMGVRRRTLVRDTLTAMRTLR